MKCEGDVFVFLACWALTAGLLSICCFLPAEMLLRTEPFAVVLALTVGVWALVVDLPDVLRARRAEKMRLDSMSNRGESR